jgi:hypothetical protein
MVSGMGLFGYSSVQMETEDHKQFSLTEVGEITSPIRRMIINPNMHPYEWEAILRLTGFLHQSLPDRTTHLFFHLPRIEYYLPFLAAYEQGWLSQSPFPQLRALSLIECATHVIFDAVFAPCRVGENQLVQVVLRSVESDMLVLMDRGLFAGWLFEAIRAKGAHALAALEAGMLTKPLDRLHDGSEIVVLTPRTSLRLQHPISLRVITYRLSAPGLPWDGHVRRLVTTLLDPREAPALTLIEIYHDRWEVELSIDEHKNHLRLAKQPLRSRKPETVYQEAYGMALLHTGLRMLMHQAAGAALAARGEPIDARRVSFRLSCEQVQRSVEEFSLVLPELHPRLRARLLTDLVHPLLPPRRLRFNARFVKRPLSRFRRKRFWHLDGPHFKGTSFPDLVSLNSMVLEQILRRDPD